MVMIKEGEIKELIQTWIKRSNDYYQLAREARTGMGKEGLLLGAGNYALCAEELQRIIDAQTDEADAPDWAFRCPFCKIKHKTLKKTWDCCKK